MIELFLDTANTEAIIALLKDKKVLKQINIISNNDLSSNIFKYLEELFKDSNIAPNEVNKIYVSNGPGSFTGIRIGLSIAKVYAFTLNISLVPISTLEIMASSSDESLIIPIIDARREHVYSGVYNGNLDKLEEEKYIHLEDLKTKYLNALYLSYDSFDVSTTKPIINIEKVVNKHRDDKVPNAHSINPNYLKITEAEANLKND